MMNEEFFELEKKDIITNYNTKGVQTLESEVVAAKKVESGGKTFFKVAIYNGSAYNPLGIYADRDRIKNLLTYKKVSQDIFDKYVKFLKEKKINLFNVVNREILDA